MAIRGVLHFAILLCCLCCYGNVEGGHRKLSKKEELEIEKQLKLLNKPAVKTITTESGDIYDCIDFYKQPAFDHPLLKNHTYHYKDCETVHGKSTSIRNVQKGLHKAPALHETCGAYSAVMRPISPNKRTGNKEPSLVGEPLEIGLQSKGCTIGTVPIRRTTKEDLIRAKLFTETYASKFNPLTAERPGLRRAVIRTKSYPAKKYNGGAAEISVYQPGVTGSQYSSAQITIRGGSDSIQFGWTVNPDLYGDTRTRLFTFLQAGSSSCFNTQCPGFIIVNTHIPLDVVLGPVSTRGGPIYSISLFVYKDQFSGNWWLEIASVPNNYTQVGFWPEKIFGGLKDLATYVEWGGEAYSPPGLPGPGMGSGQFPAGDTNFDAFCERVTTINEAHDPEDAENTEIFSDDRKYYIAEDWKGIRGEYGHVMTFGGPGPK